MALKAEHLFEGRCSSLCFSFHLHSNRQPSLSLHLFGPLFFHALRFFCLWRVCCSVQAVLSAHDTVAQKNFDPVLPPLPEDLDDDFEEESVKIVRLVKNKEPLVRRLLSRLRIVPTNHLKTSKANKQSNR